MKRTFRKCPSSYVKAGEDHASSKGYRSTSGRYITINDLKYKYNVLNVFDSFTICINDSIGLIGAFKLDEIPDEYTNVPIKNITTSYDNVMFVIDNPNR